MISYPAEFAVGLSGWEMGFNMALFAMRAVETLFFIGLAGCTVVVLFSWVSVVKGCLTDEK
ncbi:MAG TPA: hypothetical protein VGL22_07980 [Terracidiphilus sp.]|jgi:hypothetical protein